jgi:hypothetical protein
MEKAMEILTMELQAAGEIMEDVKADIKDLKENMEDDQQKNALFISCLQIILNKLP